MTTDLVIHWRGLDGPRANTLVLLHGLTDSGSCWADAVARWEGSYRIAAIDARGHGRSPRFTAQELASGAGDVMVADALEVIGAIAAKGADVVVVGHSMGGAVASAAASRSDLVRGAVLEEPAWFDLGEEDRADNAVEWVESVEPFIDDLDAAIAAGRRQNPLWPEVEFPAWGIAKTQTDLAFLRGGSAVPSTPWIESAEAVAVPTLLVTGDRDVIMGDDKLSRLAEMGTSAITARVIAGAGHCVRRDRTDEFLRLVDPGIAAQVSRPCST
jgi:pimeloyl-ACP methyl ester carboxylesterase